MIHRKDSKDTKEGAQEQETERWRIRDTSFRSGVPRPARGGSRQSRGDPGERFTTEAQRSQRKASHHEEHEGHEGDERMGLCH